MNQLFSTIRLLGVSMVLLISGCVSMSTIQAPSGPDNKGLTSYTRAYIEQAPNDEFLIYQALVYELNDMGMEVIATPFKDATDGDLLVKYSFTTGWDFIKYLKSFQFQFIDALSGKLVSSTSFRSVGIWIGARDGRLKRAFNDLRKKNGLPPTSQFPNTTSTEEEF